MSGFYFLKETVIVAAHTKEFSFSLFCVASFEPPRRLPVKKTRQQLQREKALLEQSQKLGLQGGPASLPPEQLLSAPKQRITTPEPHSPPARTCPSPAALTSPVGDGELLGTENQPRKAGLENSRDGQENCEVLPPKTDCKSEKKKVELLVSLIRLSTSLFDSHWERELVLTFQVWSINYRKIIPPLYSVS